MKTASALRFIRRHLLPVAVAAPAVLIFSSCGAWWGSTSVGSDLYVGDYYPSYNPIYYPDYSPGYYPVGWYPGGINTPPPPPPSPGPVIVVPGNRPEGNPGGINRPPQGNPGAGNNPSQGMRPPQNNGGGVGTPAQGGFRGQTQSTGRH